MDKAPELMGIGGINTTTSPTIDCSTVGGIP